MDICYVLSLLMGSNLQFCCLEKVAFLENLVGFTIGACVCQMEAFLSF